MAVAQVIHQFDLPAIKAVFQATEFIGLSSYPSLNAVFRESDLENALWQFARELKYFGVNLEQVPTAFPPSLKNPSDGACITSVTHRTAVGSAETRRTVYQGLVAAGRRTKGMQHQMCSARYCLAHRTPAPPRVSGASSSITRSPPRV